MTNTTSIEEILDKHAEYYIRQTMKFFQEKGKSPALSKNNKSDLAAKQAIEAYVAQKVLLARKDELGLACHQWEKDPSRPATYMINRTEQLTNNIGGEDE